MPDIALPALIFWIAIGAYVYGKRRGKPWRYALASAPVAFVIYTALFVALAHLT